MNRGKWLLQRYQYLYDALKDQQLYNGHFELLYVVEFGENIKK